MFYWHSDCHILFEMWNIFEHVLRYFTTDNNYKLLEHVYMILEVNSNRFEMSFRLHGNLLGDFTDNKSSTAHVQMISFN